MSYYKIENLEQYFKHYNKSVRAKKILGNSGGKFYLVSTMGKVVDFNMAEGDIKWFTEAKLNITKNCIDRHLNKEDKTAIIFEPNNPAEEVYFEMF
jgi:acetyl-CoA synthetase